MAYDRELAQRVRDQLGDVPGIAEKAMFGGLAFLLDGNMSVGVTHDDLMVRVGADASEDALTRPHTRVFDMTGRPMKAWVLVAPAGVETDEDFADWVQRGVAYASSLPPKG